MTSKNEKQSVKQNAKQNTEQNVKQNTKQNIKLNRKFYKLHPGVNPGILFKAALLFLVLSYLFIYLIDGQNILGLQALIIDHFHPPLFWFHWFTTPVEEPLQWYILGFSLVFFAFIAGTAYKNHDTPTFKFWGLLSLGFVLMLVEDAGDIRHTYRNLIESVTGEFYGQLSILFELAYFGIIAFLMLFALVRYYRVYWPYAQARNYLITGYILYGLGVSASFIGNATYSILGYSVYAALGDLILNHLLVTTELSQKAYAIAAENFRVNFFFVDKVLEESVELLGATSLLVAALYFFKQYREFD